MAQKNKKKSVNPNASAEDISMQNQSKTANQTDQNQTDNTLSELKIRVQSLEAERDDWKDKALRSTAEVQNVQRQVDFDTATAKKSAKKYVAQTLLGFLNTLNLAFTFTPQTDNEKVQKFVDTLKGSYTQVQNDLNGVGIELIVPQQGEEFNGETMTALNEKSEEEEYPTVKNVASVGLKVDGQVIQPASVMV